LEFFSIEEIAKSYGIAIHKARRCLSGKGKSVDIKVVNKNKKLYSKELVLVIFGEPPIEPTESQNPSKTEKNESTDDLKQKPLFYTTNHIKQYKTKIIYLKRMVANLERENNHLRTQNQNLTTLLAMEKQAAIQSPKNDIKNDVKTNETSETALSIGLLFLFVCGAILLLFFAFYLVS
jgi:hypothetical protein